MGRPKNTDKIITNQDMDGQELDPIMERNDDLQSENAILRAQLGEVLDRMTRLESIQNPNKLRKFDELNDPQAIKKIGRIPSMDGKDPIVLLERSGKSWVDTNGNPVDEQVWKIVTHSGEQKILPLMEGIQACSGNSIPCIVNDWEECKSKMKELADKRHKYQRSPVRMSRLDTVSLIREIEKEEKSLTINVTLSEDYGKSFNGLTLDVPFNSVFNAVP